MEPSQPSAEYVIETLTKVLKDLPGGRTGLKHRAAFRTLWALWREGKLIGSSELTLRRITGKEKSIIRLLNSRLVILETMGEIYHQEVLGFLIDKLREHLEDGSIHNLIERYEEMLFSLDAEPPGKQKKLRRFF